MGKFFVAQFVRAMIAACLSPADVPPIPTPEDRPVAFTEIDVRASRRPPGEARRVITSMEDYMVILGGLPPPEIDFRKHAVVFYTAGMRPTGGYEAHIGSIRASRDGALIITTELTAPGPHCIVTQAITFPYVIAVFPREEAARRVVFHHDNQVRDCR